MFAGLGELASYLRLLALLDEGHVEAVKTRALAGTHIQRNGARRDARTELLQHGLPVQVAREEAARKQRSRELQRLAVGHRDVALRNQLLAFGREAEKLGLALANAVEHAGAVRIPAKVQAHRSAPGADRGVDAVVRPLGAPAGQNALARAARLACVGDRPIAACRLPAADTREILAQELVVDQPHVIEIRPRVALGVEARVALSEGGAVGGQDRQAVDEAGDVPVTDLRAEAVPLVRETAAGLLSQHLGLPVDDLENLGAGSCRALVPGRRPAEGEVVLRVLRQQHQPHRPVLQRAGRNGEPVVRPEPRVFLRSRHRRGVYGPGQVAEGVGGLVGLHFVRLLVVPQALDLPRARLRGPHVMGVFLAHEVIARDGGAHLLHQRVLGDLSVGGPVASRALRVGTVPAAANNLPFVEEAKAPVLAGDGVAGRLSGRLHRQLAGGAYGA